MSHPAKFKVAARQYSTRVGAALTILILAVSGAVLAGCGRTAAVTPTYKIAMIPKMNSSEYWDVVHAGADEAVAELNRNGAHVELIWHGPDDEGAQDRQIALIDDFVRQRVSAIILSPQDRSRMAGPVAAAAATGIPVITFDSTLNALNPTDVTAYVGTDNYAAGRVTADYVAQRLGEKGHVLMQRYLAGSASSMEREAGFANRLVEAHPGVTLLPWNEYTGPERTAALQKCRDALAAYGPQADAIFASTQFVGNEMLRAVHETNPAKPIPLVVFDTNPVLVDALRQGEVDALVIQSEKQIGRDAVLLAYRKVRGEVVSRTSFTPVTIATRANMGEQKIQELLSPTGH